MKKVTRVFIKKFIPKRSRYSSKIDGGRVLIVAGGKGLYGAGILSALSATRCGAGYTHLMTDLYTFPFLKFPDFIVHPLKITELKNFPEERRPVIAIGPGMGTKKEQLQILKYLIEKKYPYVIADADALTILAKLQNVKLPATWILTPHSGEMARLLKTTSHSVELNRLESLLRAQKKYGCIILLKGSETLVASASEVYKISSGTKALAKAGSGDVLLGMIAAFYAQIKVAETAALVGAFVHGYASSLWIKEKRDYLSMRPTDLIDLIPTSLHLLRK